MNVFCFEHRSLLIIHEPRRLLAFVEKFKMCICVQSTLDDKSFELLQSFSLGLTLADAAAFLLMHISSASFYKYPINNI